MTYVTFLYELNRDSWPEQWRRPFQDYLQRWKATLESLSKSGQRVIAFGDDARVESIAQTFSPRITYIAYPLQNWDSWDSLEKTKLAVLAKFNSRVPEHFSAEYICLQLCKFDAMRFAIEHFQDNADTWIWVDGGLRDNMTPSTWKVFWREPTKIQISLFKPYNSVIGDKLYDSYYNTYYFTYVIGTCWGGTAANMLWLCAQVKQISKNLLRKGSCGNDQQILSMIHSSYPERFSTRKAYSTNMLGLLKERWDFACSAVNSNINEPENDPPVLQNVVKAGIVLSGIVFLFRLISSKP